MIHFISFANKPLKKTLARIESEALNSNFFDTVSVFDEDTLDKDHLNYCLNNNRGFGFWSWKSVIVWRKLNEMKFGDILVYSDAGNTVNLNGEKKFKEYIDFLQNHSNDAIFFQMDHLEKKFSKMDLIDYLDSYELLETGQITACCFLIKKTERIIKLIEKWNHICINNKNLIDDSTSSLQNDKSFVDHRHDQSILSILVKKMGINMFPEDDTYKFVYLKDNTYPINCTRLRY
jgi:hypothetical protein